MLVRSAQISDLSKGFYDALGMVGDARARACDADDPDDYDTLVALVRRLGMVLVCLWRVGSGNAG